MVGATIFILSEMKRLADSVGAQLVVPYLPFYFDDGVLRPPPGISVFAREAGIMLLSMHSVWSNRKKNGSTFVYEGEGHLNAQGHRDVAEEIARALTASWA